MPNTFTRAELADLPHVISAPRFATYLRARNGDVEAALALYRWNLQVSAAFFVPLQVCEVALRNGVVEAIAALYGPGWPWSHGFRRSLASTGRRPPQQELVDVGGQYRGRPGQVVANLSFAFWQKMFSVSHQQRLWDPHLRAVFPALPAGMGVTGALGLMHGEIEHIRRLRNRIAHHEPIHARNIADDLAVIERLIGYRNPGAAAWVDRVQTISNLLAERP